MTASFHIIVFLFIVFALVDVALLSVRALLSRQRHSLTTLYALMGVQQAMIVFELFATLGPLLSSYLVTAGMWDHIVRLFAVFFPLWLLRCFFTAFTMVYKNILIPRWTPTAAAREELGPGVVTHSVRAWHAAGYGAVVVLDVVCCCVYYLSAVYVLGYFSDKTLYVPYHRRRWRHEQLERASAAAAALADAAARRGGSDATPPLSSLQREQHHRKRQHKRGRDEQDDHSGKQHHIRGGDAVFPVTSLARTPSFAQWQHRHSHTAAAASPDTQSSLHAGNVALTAGENHSSSVEGVDNRDPVLAGRGLNAGLASFSSVSSTSHNVGADGLAAERDNTVVFSGPAADASDAAGSAAPPAPTTGGGTPLHDDYGKPKTQRVPAGGMASHRRVASDPALLPTFLRPRQPSSFLSDLPPLRLPRRFTLSSEGEEGQMNQFAAALVEHGFTTQTPERRKSAVTSVIAKTACPKAYSSNSSRKQASRSSDTVMARKESVEQVAGEAAAAPRDEPTDAALPGAVRQSNTSNSVDDAMHGTGGHLRRNPSEHRLRPSGGAAASVSAGRGSFRRLLSAWKGFNGGHSNSASNAAATEGSPQQQQQQPSASPSPSPHACRASAKSLGPPLSCPPQRKRSMSLVRFALDGSGSGDTRDGGSSTPPLPPRPRPSFRIDQATGNVVAVLPDSSEEPP
jgi:hypothetical protein